MIIDASTNSASTLSRVEWVDTHAHLNFNAYKNDLDEVIKRTLADDVWVINIGTNYQTSKKAVEIAQNYREGIYAAIGLHPIYSTPGLVKIKTDPEEGSFTTNGEDFDIEKYRELAKSKKVVAIGEIGLDFYYRPKTKLRQDLFKQKQKEVFLQQLELAKELNLPVIFHCRMAHQDLLEILNSQFSISNFQLKGVVHCFTGNLEEAEEYIKLGFYIGLNGIIFKLNLDEVIKSIPLDKILIETDCPYLKPPKAGKDRNEPIFVKYVAEKIANIKNISFEKVTEVTTQSAKELFRL